MKNYFITATGTDIGKTFVTHLLVTQLRARGIGVRALKPLVTGYTDETAQASDTRYLLDAMGLPMTVAQADMISPWRYAAPLAPNMAARREGRQVDWAAVVDFCLAAIKAKDRAEDILLIEGVGGVMVPLDDGHTVLDWMCALKTPALLVTGSYLGSISHTLSAAEVLRVAGIPLAGIVVSETPGATVDLQETAAVIEGFVKNVRVQILPRQKALGLAPDLTYLLD